MDGLQFGQQDQRGGRDWRQAHRRLEALARLDAADTRQACKHETFHHCPHAQQQQQQQRDGDAADDDVHIASEEGVHVTRMPEHYAALPPILHVVPLQLLASHTACARGTDVDKPRNLAKSVTAE